MIAFLPPISQTTFLTKAWPGRGSAAIFKIRRPTSFEPVKAIKATRGSPTSISPTSPPAPGRYCKTSPGTPACQRISQSSRAMPRVCDDGLTTAVLPVTNAAVVMPAQMAKGKFQGLMIAATPRG